MKHLVLGIALVSGLSFGYTLDGKTTTLVGGGVWKEPKGATGKWKATTEVGGTKEAFTVKETLLVYSDKGEEVHKETNDLTLKATGKSEGFYEISEKGKAVGTGYCFHSTCHFDYTAGSEETLHFAKNGVVFRMGSDNSKEGLVAWNGMQRPQHSSEEELQQGQQQQHQGHQHGHHHGHCQHQGHCPHHQQNQQN